MMLLHLVLSSLVLAVGASPGDGETQPPDVPITTRPPIIVFSPPTTPTTTTPTTTTMTTVDILAASQMMPEAKRVPDGVTMWSPSSSSDLTPMMMHHQLAMPPVAPMPQPQAVYLAVSHSSPAPPQQPLSQPQQQQHFMPANYHLPADDEFPGSQYGPPASIGSTSSSSSSNEYRSEQYSSYPTFEQTQSSYPLLQQQTPLPQQQQLDTSLIPTAKHFVLVSFIGLLLLFAIIQNSISAAKRKDALVEVLSNRKKRDIIALTNLNKMTPQPKSALKEDARVRCVQRTLCYENGKLQHDLGGIFGNLFGKYVTQNVQNSLRESSPGWDRLVQDATDPDSGGDDCDVIYRDCSRSRSSSSSIGSSSSQAQLTNPTELQVAG